MINIMALRSNCFLSCFPRNSLGLEESGLRQGTGTLMEPLFREVPGPAVGTHGCFTSRAGEAGPWTRGGFSMTAPHYPILLAWRRSAQSPVFWESYCKHPGLGVLLFLKYSLLSTVGCPKQEEALMCNLSGIRCHRLFQGTHTHTGTARAGR